MPLTVCLSGDKSSSSVTQNCQVKYNHESLQNIFSTSKALSSLVVALLADRGLLSYDQPVCELWPEFVQSGKQAITVADVMRHDGGLATLGTCFSFDQLSADGIRRNDVGRVIEAATPAWPTEVGL